MKQRYSILMVFTIWIAASNCQQQPYSDGEALYKTHCANCHMDNGEGLPGLIPPLAKADYLATHRQHLPCILRKGLEGNIAVNGKTYAEKMPGVAKLTDVEITNILNYVGNSWGNDLDVFRLEEVRSSSVLCDDLYR